MARLEQKHISNHPDIFDAKERQEFYDKIRKDVNLRGNISFSDINELPLKNSVMYQIKNVKRLIFEGCDIERIGNDPGLPNVLSIENNTDSIIIDNCSFDNEIWVVNNYDIGRIEIKNSIVNALCLYNCCKMNRIILHNSVVEKLILKNTIVQDGIRLVNGIKNNKGLHMFDECDKSEIRSLSLNNSFVNQSRIKEYNNRMLPESLYKLYHYDNRELKDIVLESTNKDTNAFVLADSYIFYDENEINISI